MNRIAFTLAMLAAGCGSLAGIDDYVDLPGGGSGGNDEGGGGTSISSTSTGGGDGGSGGDATGGDGGGGSPQTCPAPGAGCKRVFVTEMAHPSNFGGAIAADELCAAEAGEGTWVAWVSDGSSAAGQRLQDVPGGWCLANGTLVAGCKEELLQGELRAPIDRTFTDLPADEQFAWTGTMADGNLDEQSCSDWTATEGPAEGAMGFTSTVTTGWTRSAATLCFETAARLYCFEQ